MERISGPAVRTARPVLLWWHEKEIGLCVVRRVGSGPKVRGCGVSSQPERACRFRLDLQADDFKSLCSAMFNIADMLERRELTTGCSGGYDSGYIYELRESPGPSHDEYFERLTAYLAEKRAADNPSDGR
jgi:hypothetical protein